MKKKGTFKRYRLGNMVADSNKDNAVGFMKRLWA
jgi:hypothetical protein